MKNRWVYHTLSPEQQAAKETLANELSISPILAELLVQRGVNTFEEAKSFFRPSLDDLHNPFLMADMDKAVERLTAALQENEKILVYGDYDVDGTTSVSMVYRFLTKYSSQVGFYVPDRYSEGYGISVKSIEFAAENGFSLVIALDCGIKAVEKIGYANSLGVDFIICDHHTPDSKLPPAVAVLDPKRDDCAYPYKHLSGCGVGFKLLQAFAEKNNIDFQELIPLLDLVALSIASDIVPITGENRILAFFGLKQLNSRPSPGVQGMIDVCGLKDKQTQGEISVSDIVFKIGPRINASGRMTLAAEAVQLLISKNVDFVKGKSETINDYNNERKELDSTSTEEAIATVKNNEKLLQKKSIVLFNPEWKKGIIGIVASRLTEEFYKPSIVMTESEGLASGSARSVAGFDLYRAIETCRDLLENFGGHTYAAGLSMKKENVPAFMERFEQYVAENITEEQLSPQIDIDAVIEFKDITPKFFRILKQFAPYGPDNMKPVFVSKQVFDYEDKSRLVGKDQTHLKLALIDSSSENVMNGIAFKMHEFNEPLKALNPLDICYTLEENTFAGNTSIQLMIRDIKVSNEENKKFMAKIITLTGDLGSGKSTVSEILCKTLNYNYIYTGKIQRGIAEKLGMSTTELNRYAETHPEIDEEIDATFKSLNNAEHLVVDSRLAWFFIPSSFKVFLQTDLQVSVQRITADKQRKGESYQTQEEAAANIVARKASENKRYLELYGADCSKMSNYDLVINTSYLTPNEVATQILEGYENALKTILPSVC